jgi:PRC-barrel domain
MADPVSWLMIEPGWRVVDAAGEEIGRVEAVTGDSDADIFDGISVASGMFARPRYVPAEQVAAIVDGQVALRVDRVGLEGLAEYEEPAESVEIEPEKASVGARTEEAVVGQDPREHRETLVRRIAAWFGLAGRR